jgi:hypothetical protein
LNAGKRRPAPQIGQKIGPGNAPGREIGESRVVNFTGLHQVIEGAENLLNRRHAVGKVRPVKIDAIGLETLQTFFNGADHILAVVTRAGHAVVRVRPDGVFGRKHKMVPVGGDELADNFLGLPELITVGRVDEVAARFGVGIENFFGFGALGAMTPPGAEVARAQRQFSNAQSRASTENLISHTIIPLRHSNGGHRFSLCYNAFV